MKFIFSIILVIIGSLSIFAQDQHNLEREVARLIEFEFGEIKFEENEGIWVGVIDHDSTFIFKLGEIKEDSLALFQIGGLSKVFTYYLSQQVFQENDLDLDSSVSELLGLTDTYKDIQVADLLYHQSKLPKEPYFFGKLSKDPSDPYISYPDQIITRELNKWENLYPSNKEDFFNYSHLNYALLGLLLQKESSLDYCQLVRERFEEMYPSLGCSDEKSNLVEGYAKSGESDDPWRFPGFAASEGLSLHLIDLLAFVRKEMFINHSEGPSFEVNKYVNFTAPWYKLDSKKSKEIYSFSGTTEIHSTFVCFDRKNETAVVMLRNSGKGLRQLPLSVLNMVTYDKKFPKRKKYHGKTK